MDRRDMPADLYVPFAQPPGHDRLAVWHGKIANGKRGEELTMNVENGIDSVKSLGAVLPCITPLDGLLSIDMGDGQSLACGKIRIIRKVFAQRLFNLVGTGMLALDSIGVIGVHPAQQRTKFGRNRPADELHRGSRQIVSFGE